MYIFTCLFMVFFLKSLGEFIKTYIISAGSLTKFCVKIWKKRLLLREVYYITTISVN